MAVPQVIVFLLPNGSLACEEPSANGARRKVPLTEGFELSELRAALYDQKSRIDERVKRVKEIEEAERRARRKRVYDTTFERHGDKYAKIVAPDLYAKDLAKSQRIAKAPIGIRPTVGAIIRNLDQLLAVEDDE